MLQAKLKLLVIEWFQVWLEDPSIGFDFMLNRATLARVPVAIDCSVSDRG